MSRRQMIFIGLSVLVSAVFLWLALRDVPLSQIWDTLKQANLLFVLAGFLSMSLGLYTRAIRWSGLLDFKLSVRKSFFIMSIGFLLNNLPLRAGEFARALLATREGIPLVAAATSVVFERLMDTLLVVVLLVFAISSIPNAPASITTPTKLFGAAVLIAFAILIFFARYPEVGHRTIKTLKARIPFLRRLPLENWLDHILVGLKPLTHWRSGLHAVIWTLISWAVSFLTTYLIVLALPFPPEQRFLLTLLSLTLASFSIAIPASIAAIGPFEAAVKVAGQTVGVLDQLSVALGFLFHGVNIFGYSFWGVIGMMAMGVSLADVMSGEKAEKTGA